MWQAAERARRAEAELRPFAAAAEDEALGFVEHRFIWRVNYPDLE